jgi:hypothetical protein
MERTIKQFEEIASSCNDGGWTKGAKMCVTHGFLSNDLILAQEMAKSNRTVRFTDDTDLAIVIEMATKLRCNG